jgi:tetratricopeptide (TPR) repeat protein
VIKLQEKTIGAENPETVNSRDTLADALEGQGKYAEAEAEYRSVAKLREKLLGPEHPQTLASRSSLAKTLLAEGKDAEADMREVIRLREKVIGADHPDTLESCYDFASGLRHGGKIEEAKEFARRAAEGARKVLGPGHPSTRKYEKLLADLESKR